MRRFLILDLSFFLGVVVESTAARVCLSGLLVLLLSQLSAAEPYVELDLDGVLGNGPDVGTALPDDTVEVAVWLHHDMRFCGAVVTLVSECAHADSVKLGDYDGYYNPPAIGPDTTTIAWYGFSFCEPLIEPPVYFASIFYVADECPCSVNLSEENSWWMDIQFNSGVFTDTPAAVLCDGSIGTEPVTWGTIKKLFR